MTNTEIHRMNPITSLYHAHDLISNGKKYLVNNMLGNIKTEFNLNYMSLSEEEICTQMLMSHFVNKLTRSLQKDFGQVLNHIHELYVSRKTTPICKLPTSYSDIRRMYIDGEGSITRNVPIPNIVIVGNHSYVSLLDCVADFLIRRDNLISEINDWNTTLHENNINHDMHLFSCERVKEILNEANLRINNAMIQNTLKLVPIFITIWSDDFDPNKSIKSNRQSVWIKTVTIFSMNNKCEKIKITYPISLSLKKTNNINIESKFLEELNQLRQGKLLVMYSRSHNSLVYVHGNIFSVMNDQPERRTNLTLANGNSKVHGRFGLLLDCAQVQNYIRSCKACSESIIDEAMDIQKESYKWRSRNCIICTGWLFNMKSKLLHYEPDKQFPSIYLSNNTNTLQPKSITKSYIETSVNQLRKDKLQGLIKLPEAKCYLRYLGLSNAASEAICNNWEHDFTLPPSWYDFDSLSIFVDVPMHLIMLGVIKAVMLKIGKWMRSLNLNAKFIVMSKDILGSIKSLNVEWCKILHYPKTDKTGGWVSENFAAMGRLGIWFYSLLQYFPDEKDGMENRNDVVELIKSTCLMAKIFMSNDTTNEQINRVEAIVRMFLIYYDKVDSFVNDNEVPSWITQFNMLCLLNIPDIMRKYGSLRNIWEGGMDGEAYIKNVKRQLSSGMVNEWKVWVISNLLKEEMYREWNIIENNINKIRSEIRVYSNYKEAKKSFKSGRPFSALLYSNNIFICYRKQGLIIGNQIRLHNKEILIYEQEYHSIIWKNKTIQTSDLNEYIGIIMLPMLHENGYTEWNVNKKYCYIRSDWN